MGITPPTPDNKVLMIREQLMDHDELASVIAEEMHNKDIATLFCSVLDVIETAEGQGPARKLAEDFLSLLLELKRDYKELEEVRGVDVAQH